MMKHYLLFFAVLVFSLAQAQDQGQTYYNISQRFDSELAKYNCESKKGKTQIVQDTIFKVQYRKIFSTVILNSEDIINNGSAFSFAVDEDKNTFSFNGSFFLSKHWNGMLNLGLNMKQKDNNFTFYSDGQWASETGGKAGIVIPVHKKTQKFFSGKKCTETMSKRIDAMHKKKIEYRNLLSNNVSDLRDKLTEFETALSQQAEFSSTDTINYVKRIQKLRMDIETLEKMRQFNDEQVAQLVRKELSAFDIDNSLFVGYAAHWVNINASFANRKVEFTNQSIISSEFQETINGLYKFSGETSYNYNSDSKKRMFFVQLMPARLNRSSYLDDISLKKQDLLIAPVEDPSGETDTFYNITNTDGVIIGRYDDIKDAIWNVDMGAYFAMFCLYEKTLGFALRTNFNFPAFNNLQRSYTNNFTVLPGVLLRMPAGSSWTSATLALNAGVQNIPYNVNVWDHFLVKASVGIPFSVFSKSKDKDKK